MSDLQAQTGCKRRKEDEKKKVCEICKKRNISEDDQGIDKPKTKKLFSLTRLWMVTKGLALIVARVGLNTWLNGDMVRTMFVTEVNGIEREIISLGSVKQFEDGDKELKKYFTSTAYNYQRIKEDINSFSNGDDDRARHTAFLYDRRPA